VIDYPITLAAGGSKLSFGFWQVCEGKFGDLVFEHTIPLFTLLRSKFSQWSISD
jgi:hypothetical protein